MIDFQTHPEDYRHWILRIDDRIAFLDMAVDPHGGIDPGYELKLNSYDLGVDIELADAVQRLRFEHPEVGAVVIGSKLDRMFCAGANIGMLATASHPLKVNFCKFTNETRIAIEDATRNSGQRYIAALGRQRRGRGLRASARHRPHHADRRPECRGVPSRAPAARCSTRNRWPDPSH